MYLSRLTMLYIVVINVNARDSIIFLCENYRILSLGFNSFYFLDVKRYYYTMYK